MLIFVCVRGCIQGESLDWARRVCESMLHMAGQTSYIGSWELQGGVGVVPVCMLTGTCEGQTGQNPGYSKMEPLELDKQGRHGRTGRRQETQQKKALQVEREPHPDWQSVVVKVREPGQDNKINSG